MSIVFINRNKTQTIARFYNGKVRQGAHQIAQIDVIMSLNTPNAKEEGLFKGISIKAEMYVFGMMRNGPRQPQIVRSDRSMSKICVIQLCLSSLYDLGFFRTQNTL